MKRIYFTILFCLPILLAPLLSSAQGMVEITGSVMGANEADRVKVIVDKYYVGTTKERQSLEVKKGGFKTEVELDQARFLTIRYNEAEVAFFVEPGQDLQLVFTAADFENTLRIAGSAAPANRYLEDFEKQFTDWESETKLTAKALADNIDLFEMDLYQARLDQRKFLNEYKSKDKLSASFLAYAKRHIELNYWSTLYAYPIRRANERVKDLEVPKIPDIMLEDFDTELLNDATALLDPAQRHLIWYYITYETSKTNDFKKYTDMGKSMTDKYNTAFNSLEDESRVYYLTRLLHEYCIKTPPSVVRRVHKALESLDEEGEYTKIATERCGDRMQEEDEALVQEESLEDNGVGASSFKMTNLQGKKITLKEFKGKVVYIDFWASWCGPCRKQFPFAEALKKDLTKSQKKQIVFLYISIDNTEQIWKSAIEKLGIEGYHVLSTGGWNSAAVKFFGINSIPRYMIVDKSGKIVDIDAKRPQMQGLKDDLLKLL